MRDPDSADSPMMTLLFRSLILVFCAISIATCSVEKVKVNFYGEALCPFCEKFLTKDVSALYDSGFLSQYVDFRYIPYGNAKVVDGKVCMVMHLLAMLNACGAVHLHTRVFLQGPSCVVLSQHCTSSLVPAHPDGVSAWPRGVPGQRIAELCNAPVPSTRPVVSICSMRRK